MLCLHTCFLFALFSFVCLILYLALLIQPCKIVPNSIFTKSRVFVMHLNYAVTVVGLYVYVQVPVHITK